MRKCIKKQCENIKKNGLAQIILQFLIIFKSGDDGYNRAFYFLIHFPDSAIIPFEMTFQIYIPEGQDTVFIKVDISVSC